MSPRFPRVTAAQLLRALQHAGWYRDHQTGSHVFLRHETLPGTINVPFHAGKVIKPSILGHILDYAGLNAEELRRLM